MKTKWAAIIIWLYSSVKAVEFSWYGDVILDTCFQNITSILEGFIGTSNDAASFLNRKLDYLVTSRPTIVNLSNAVTKLKGAISNAATTAFEAMSVFQDFLEAAEDMLREDVAANRAIGLYGASFLRGHIKNSKSLSILTHCNTGSLAIAGYGTALGVIRSVYVE